jgi:hypothetical protein
VPSPLRTFNLLHVDFYPKVGCIPREAGRAASRLILKVRLGILTNQEPEWLLSSPTEILFGSVIQGLIE